MNNNNHNNNHINNNITYPIDSNDVSLNTLNSINSSYNSSNINSITQLESNLNSNVIEPVNNSISQVKTWKVATQNIRGLNEELKQQLWWKFCIENNLDIIALTETNLIKRNEWIIFNTQKDSLSNDTRGYYTWWASKTKGGRGAGVGIMVNLDLAPHVYKIDRYEARAICLYLSFKGKFKVQIVAVYAPTRTTAHSNDIKKLKQWLMNKLSEALSKDMISITLGDWNAVPNPKKDRFPNRRLSSPESTILPMIIDMGYEDCIQINETNDREYTYHEYQNGILRSASRIDQIWIHPKYIDRITNYSVEDTTLFAKSDHHMVLISIDASQWIDNYQYRRAKQHNKKKKKLLWNLKEASVEHWDKFGIALNNSLNSAKECINVDDDLEQRWQCLKTAIISAGNQELPRAKEPKNKINIPKNTHKDFSLIYLISKVHRIGKLISQGKLVSDTTLRKFEKNCALINSKKENLISTFPENNVTYQKEWVSNIREIWNALKKVIKIDMLNLRSKTISKYIKRRQGFLETSPIKMISSAIEREQRQIVLDRIIITEGDGTVQIITSPEIIKQEVKTHLFNWTANPREEPIYLPSKWQNQYTPRKDIRPEIYHPLLIPITIQEVEEVISNFNNGKAPGPSQIPYEIYKHMTSMGMEEIIEIFNMVLDTGKVPKDWTTSSVVLIPKPKDWEGNLEITRPITLMETLRKIFTKILNDRLAKILSNHQILSQSNWAGLPGGRTAYPIHILNNLMEDAREQNKELWLLFQDIRRAFDSVDSSMLIKSMERIRIPENIIKIIEDIAMNRMARGITEYGDTEPYEVQRGVDQGDSISPLLWCIFYDPLLCEIASLKMGYKMECEWDIDLAKKSTNMMSNHTSSLAYMDDTVWISDNKEHMQQIIRVAESFFNINLITVNASKSDLIVINSKNTREENAIDFVESRLIPHEPDTAIRYLGIWISGDGKKKEQENKLIDNISRTTNILRRKKLTDKQIRYIINHVLFPQTEYLITDMILKDKLVDQVNAKIRQCFKNVIGFSRSIPNSILHSHWGYRIFNMEDRQLQLHATELMNRLNMNNECGLTTKIRLQSLQNRTWSTKSIWQMQTESWKGISNLGLNGRIIEMMGKYDINIQITSENKFPICPIGGNIPIETFMKSKKWYDTNREACQKHKVMFIEQLLNANMTKTLEWLRIDQINPTSIKPQWFKEVCEEVECRWEEIQQNNITNPFNRINRLAPETIEKTKLVSINSNTQILMGRVYKNPKEGSSAIPIRHYITDTIDGNEGSPIAPCDGCDLNESRATRFTNKNNSNLSKGCIFDTDIQNIYSLPHRKSVVSLSNKEDRRRRNRLLLSPFSMQTFMRQTVQNDKEIIQTGKEENTNYWKELVKFPLNLQGNIKELQDKLETHSIITAYTDGSLITKNQLKDTILSHDKGKIMGFGVTFVTPDLTTPIDIYGRIEGPPSSTRAELWAILIAIYIIPKSSYVKIHTDSASAIWSLKGFMENKKGKAWSNYKNPTILQTIIELIKGKQIKFDLIKVEAHSGNSLNERADLLAKKGLTCRDKCEINISILRDRKALFAWKNKHIDTSIKDFIKQRSEIKWLAQWRTQYRTYKWTNENIINSTDWKLTWSAIHGSKIVSNYTSNKDQQFRSFNIKIINEELPTMDKLHQRKPNIYINNKCVICEQQREDTLHIFLCGENIIKTQSTFKNRLLDVIGEHKGKKIVEIAKTKLLNMKIFEIDTIRIINGTISESNFSLIDCIKGLIPYEIKSMLIKILKNKEDSNLIIREWHRQCREYLYKLWINRCNKVLEWEKSAGITRQMKKQKSPNLNTNSIDYIETKSKLEQYKNKIIDRTIEAVFNTGTEFINNIFYCSYISQIDSSEVVTS
jgi:ribonuclease HI